MSKFFKKDSVIFRKRRDGNFVEVTPFDKKVGRLVKTLEELREDGFTSIKEVKANFEINEAWRKEISENSEKWKWNYNGRVYQPIPDSKVSKYEKISVSDLHPEWPDWKKGRKMVFYRGNVYYAHYYQGEQFYMESVDNPDNTGFFATPAACFSILRDDKKILSY